MEIAARLRALADALPPHGSVTFSRDDLEAMVGECAPVRAEPEPIAGLTVPALAAELGRSDSTVRGWLAAGEFPNAYKLQGKEWRIPQSDVHAFIESQRSPRIEESAAPLPYGDDDLGSWRKHIADRKAS
jgi:excisionase family DNA binding protein